MVITRKIEPFKCRLPLDLVALRFNREEESNKTIEFYVHPCVTHLGSADLVSHFEISHYVSDGIYSYGDYSVSIKPGKVLKEGISTQPLGRPMVIRNRDSIKEIIEGFWKDLGSEILEEKYSDLIDEIYHKRKKLPPVFKSDPVDEYLRKIFFPERVVRVYPNGFCLSEYHDNIDIYALQLYHLDGINDEFKAVKSNTTEEQASP